MDGRFQHLILVATSIVSLNLCEPAECTTSREPPPVYCEADDVIDAEQVPYFVDVLLNPEVTFEEVCYSEKMLATGPMKEVIKELLPLLEFYYTEPEICLGGGGSPQGFSLCPYPWPSARAAFRVVQTYLITSSGPISANLARQLLRDDEFSVLFPSLLHYLDGDWNEESEHIARELFEDSSSGYHTRRAAATVLLRQNPWKYYGPLVQVCLTQQGGLKAALVQLLVYESHTLKLGIDERLVRLSIEVIVEDYCRPSSNFRIAYTLAGCLNSYLGADLKPNVVSAPRALTAAQVNDRFRREIDGSLNYARKILRDLEFRVTGWVFVRAIVGSVHCRSPVL